MCEGMILDLVGGESPSIRTNRPRQKSIRRLTYLIKMGILHGKRPERATTTVPTIYGAVAACMALTTQKKDRSSDWHAMEESERKAVEKIDGEWAEER